MDSDSKLLSRFKNKIFPEEKFYDVVGIGRNCIDHLAILQSMPRIDSKVPMIRYWVEGGGQAATAMVALSRLGLKVAYVGIVGDDFQGKMVVEGLQKEGVDTSNVVIEKGIPTPVALILVDEKSGRRTIAYLDSMKGRLERSSLDRKMILSTRCIMIDPCGTLLGVEMSEEAKKGGIIIIYDAEHMVEGFYEMLSLCSYAVGSEDVIETLGLSNPEKALKKLISYGPKAAVITLGERGSIALTAGGFIRKPAYKVRVVDTTAAGDAFHAGFAYAILKKWDLEKVLEFANALGALVCRGLGGRESLPRLEEVWELLGRKP